MDNMSYNYYIIIIHVFFTFWTVMLYNCYILWKRSLSHSVMDILANELQVTTKEA